MSGIQSFSRGTETLVVPHSFSSQLSPSIYHSYIKQNNTKVMYSFENASSSCVMFVSCLSLPVCGGSWAFLLPLSWSLLWYRCQASDCYFFAAQSPYTVHWPVGRKLKFFLSLLISAVCFTTHRGRYWPIYPAQNLSLPVIPVKYHARKDCALSLPLPRMHDCAINLLSGVPLPSSCLCHVYQGPSSSPAAFFFITEKDKTVSLYRFWSLNNIIV